MAPDQTCIHGTRRHPTTGSYKETELRVGERPPHEGHDQGCAVGAPLPCWCAWIELPPGRRKSEKGFCLIQISSSQIENWFCYTFLPFSGGWEGQHKVWLGALCWQDATSKFCHRFPYNCCWDLCWLKYWCQEYCSPPWWWYRLLYSPFLPFCTLKHAFGNWIKWCHCVQYGWTLRWTFLSYLFWKDPLKVAE